MSRARQGCRVHYHCPCFLHVLLEYFTSISPSPSWSSPSLGLTLLHTPIRNLRWKFIRLFHPRDPIVDNLYPLLLAVVGKRDLIRGKEESNSYPFPFAIRSLNHSVALCFPFQNHFFHDAADMVGIPANLFAGHSLGQSSSSTSGPWSVFKHTHNPLSRSVRGGRGRPSARQGHSNLCDRNPFPTV
jgi:hypothetical protein